MNSDPDANFDWDGAKKGNGPRVGKAVISLSIAIALAALAFDLFLPLGVAAGVPYVALVLMGTRFSKPRHTYLLAVLGTWLTLVGYLASPSGGVLWVVLTNRGLALFAIWVTAFLIASRMRYEGKLVEARDNLEELVFERTRNLTDKTKNLQLLHSIMSRAYESNNAEEMVQTCLDEVCTHLNWPVGHFYIREPLLGGKLVSGKIWHHQNPEQFSDFIKASEEMVFEIGVGLPGRVMESKQPVWISDITIDTNFPRSGVASELGVRSGFAFPIIVKEGVVGVLEFFSNKAHEPDEMLLETLHHIGYQVGRVYERKKSEELLSENMKQLDFQKFALDEHAIVSFFDVRGNITYANEKFCEISEYSLEELIGKHHCLIKSDEHPPEFYTDMWVTISNGKVWQGELKSLNKNGNHYWVMSTVVPFLNEVGKPFQYIAIRTDITERKDAEIAAKMANRAKSELMANMSHELRTPLNAIIGFSDMMKGEMFGPLSEKYMQYTEDINNSGVHLLEIINDILDVSAIESGRLELDEKNLDVGNVVEATLQMLRGRAREGGILLTSNVEDGLPFIYADKRRLKQILLNLLSNAIKFTPPDGTVSFAAFLDNGKAHIFTITDTGVGMDEEELSKAMSEFGQVDSGLDRKHEGSGLGLPLTKGLIELHGGTFEIDSVKGKGTAITVRFPPERTEAC